MTWRTAPLPPDWEARRQQRFAIDGHRCTETMGNGKRCHDTNGLECHHIGENDDHRIEMLRTVCGWHHARLTSAQANAKRRRPNTKTREERHPGLL
jgi:hypothetical protein